MGVKLSGMDELLVKVDKMDKRLENDLKRVVKENGVRMQSEMTKSAQFGRFAKKPTTTGDLRKSIRTELKDSGFTAETGPNVDYAAYVEYGTRKMRAQPYAKTAYKKVAPKFLQDVQNLVK